MQANNSAAAVLTLVSVVASVTPAFAYEVERTAYGDPLRWHDTNMDLQLDEPSVSTNGPVARVRTVLTDIIDTWIPALPIDARVSITHSSNGEGPALSSGDRRNIVHWVHEGWDDDFDDRALAITMITYVPATGQIVDADIAVNAQGYAWTFMDEADCDRQYDVQAVLAHEFGHFLGMAHSPDHPEATMYPSTGTCSTTQRALSVDDIAGVGFLYASEIPGVSPLGCSVGSSRPTRAPLAFVFVGLLALLLLSRRARRSAMGFALFCLLCARGAMATTVEKLDVSTLASSSAVVARGQVVGKRIYESGGRVYTDTIVSVAECWRGPCADSVVVRQLGGEVGRRGTRVTGTGVFVWQESVVVFLRKRKDAAFAPVGMAQGIFHVIASDSGGGDTLMRDLRRLHFAGKKLKQRDGRVEIWDIDELRKLVARAKR